MRDVRYFPKLKPFSQAATSRGYFPKWLLPKCAISQAEFPKSALAAELSPLAHPSRNAPPPSHCKLRCFRRPNLTFGKFSLGKLQIWKVATWEIVNWEVAFGQTTLGKYLIPSRRGGRPTTSISSPNHILIIFSSEPH